MNTIHLYLQLAELWHAFESIILHSRDGIPNEIPGKKTDRDYNVELLEIITIKKKNIFLPLL